MMTVSILRGKEDILTAEIGRKVPLHQLLLFVFFSLPPRG